MTRRYKGTYRRFCPHLLAKQRAASSKLLTSAYRIGATRRETRRIWPTAG